jgi:hypothetical protein
MNGKPPPSATLPRRKTYSSPRLTKFGTVVALAQSGTRPGSEPMGAMMKASDLAAKENAVRIGTHPLGIGLYLFEYRAAFRSQYGTGRQFGVLAQEVETVMPQAVSRGPLGHKLVDYAMLGVWPSAS